MNSYKTSIEISQPSDAIFSAIWNELEAWWGSQNALIDRNGVIFKVSWGKPWYQFKVISYLKNKEVIWECIDANQIIEGLDGVQKDWVGTKIHWTINEISASKSRLDFEHEGLIPSFICFEFCSRAWSNFIEESLVTYLEGKE